MKKKIFFVGILVLKLALLLMFSSAIREQLFVPFVETYLTHGGDPWDFVYSQGLAYEFPYPPLMLYLVSFSYWPYFELLGEPSALEGVFFHLPTLLADLSILFLLFRLVPTKKKECLLFYFGSPIILYAIYAHSQLDLVPTAFLLAATYFLVINRYWVGALFLGCALSTKFHTAAALPLFIIYALKQRRYISAAAYVAVPMVIYLLFSYPYLSSLGYQELVLVNPKQMQIFNVSYAIGDYKIYLPLFGAALLYCRFLALRAIDQELLFIFLTILFSIFLLTVYPSPGWYVWIAPFMALFLSKMSTRKREIVWLYGALCTAYLVFFALFYRSSYESLLLVGETFNYKFAYTRWTNVAYTVLESILVINLYVLYRYGVKINRSYLRKSPVFIGIGGDSASGKTFLMKDMRNLFPDSVTVLEGDGDHRWARHDPEWSKYTHLDPKANYLNRQADNLMVLKSGQPVFRSEYDHRTGTFENPRRVVAKEHVIFCGLHPFYLPKARKAIDVKVYLEPDESLRQHWKILRDTIERGHNIDCIHDAIKSRQTDAQRFILPQRDFADVLVHYSPLNAFDVGDPKANPQLKLKITLNASLPMDAILRLCEKHGLQATWDYEDNLERQFFTVECAPSQSALDEFAQTLLGPFEEFGEARPDWECGYRGLVQIIALWVVLHKKSEVVNAQI